MAELHPGLPGLRSKGYATANQNSPYRIPLGPPAKDHVVGQEGVSSTHQLKPQSKSSQILWKNLATLTTSHLQFILYFLYVIAVVYFFVGEGVTWVTLELKSTWNHTWKSPVSIMLRKHQSIIDAWSKNATKIQYKNGKGHFEYSCLQLRVLFS